MYTNACKLCRPRHSATSQAAVLLSISTINDLCGATELCDTSQTGSTIKLEQLPQFHKVRQWASGGG